MIKQLGSGFLGIIFLIIGVIGLVIPIIPGILFLALALLCFVGISPGVTRRLRTSPRYGRYVRRWDDAAELPLVDRLRAGWWLAVGAVGDTLRAEPRRSQRDL